MPTHGTHGRYALALYMAGQKAGKLDVLDKDLQQVCGDYFGRLFAATWPQKSTLKHWQVWKMASESEEFAQFLRDPSVPRKQKSAVLQDVLNSAKVSDLTKNFFSAPPRASPLAWHPDSPIGYEWVDRLLACGSGAGRKQPPEPV